MRGAVQNEGHNSLLEGETARGVEAEAGPWPEAQLCDVTPAPPDLIAAVPRPASSAGLCEREGEGER